MAVVCATSEKNALVKKSTTVKLKASDYVGLPNYLPKNISDDLEKGPVRSHVIVGL